MSTAPARICQEREEPAVGAVNLAPPPSRRVTAAGTATVAVDDGASAGRSRSCASSLTRTSRSQDTSAAPIRSRKTTAIRPYGSPFVPVVHSVIAASPRRSSATSVQDRRRMHEDRVGDLVPGSDDRAQQVAHSEDPDDDEDSAGDRQRLRVLLGDEDAEGQDQDKGQVGERLAGPPRADRSARRTRALPRLIETPTNNRPSRAAAAPEAAM